jgi:hypothetical protein
MLRRTAVIFALAGSVLFACGCQGKPAQDDVSIEKSLHEKGTANLMDEVAKAPDYPPPADGRLTDAQVKMYFDVRQREQQIREVAFKEFQDKGDTFLESLKTVGDQPDIATADLRAAQELGFNPKEYQWVKERVLEARMLETTRALAQQVAQSRQQVLALFEQRRQEATDPVAKAEAERQLEELQKNAASAPASPLESDPAREHNADLLARFRDDFARLQAEDQRISQEIQSRSQVGESQSGGR